MLMPMTSSKERNHRDNISKRDSCRCAATLLGGLSRRFTITSPSRLVVELMAISDFGWPLYGESQT
jgi:hypothetical protein